MVIGYFPSTNTLWIIDLSTGLVFREAQTTSRRVIYAQGALHNYRWKLTLLLLLSFSQGHITSMALFDKSYGIENYMI